jgi:Putative amidase domain
MRGGTPDKPLSVGCPGKSLPGAFKETVMKKPESRIRAIVVFSLLGVGFLTGGPSSADSYRAYDAASAASYALANYNKAYGIGGLQNPFKNYGSLESGGNCTNFVSQALLGGFLNTSSPKTAYDSRFDFDIDRTSRSIYKWFFIDDSLRGPAWTGAHKLYEYAKYNKSTYKGLHFQFVTNDTLEKFMDYKKVKVGDVIFADWEHDGKIDHSMIVTNIDSLRLGYNEIRVTYQSTTIATSQKSRGLGDINEQYKKDGKFQALFYVYRPIDYNPTGL